MIIQFWWIEEDEECIIESLLIHRLAMTEEGMAGTSGPVDLSQLAAAWHRASAYMT